MKEKREAVIRRKTKETDIELKLRLDGKGRYDISTTLPFLDHMLELFSKHGGFDLTIKAKGDTQVDAHHLVEDVGLSLGAAFKAALKNKKGIGRYGFFLLPMDESLSYAAVDLSGRSHVEYEAPGFKIPWPTFDLDLIEDFVRALAMSGGMNIHLRLIRGRNNHHMAEAMFKSLAKALAMAVATDKRVHGIPSTKGII